MKSRLFIALGVLLSLGLTSCKKEYYYNDSQNQSFVYEITPNQWVDGISFFYKDLNLPELTDYYIRQGGVSAAISFDNETSYDILPSTFEGIAYSVRYSRGVVSIIAEDPLADPNVAIHLPENRVYVKIILTQASFVE